MKATQLIFLIMLCVACQAQPDHSQHQLVASASHPSSHRRSATPPAPTAVTKRIRIQVSPQQQQLIGVKTALVQKRFLKQRIRTVGKVDYNEQQISHVHTKVEGWIEKLYVDYTGKFVRRGQPLLEIYSPDLLAAQQEYLMALQTAAQFQNSELTSSRTTSRSLIDAAKRKLQLWDMSAAQIQAVAKTGRIKKSVTLYAPTTGFVIEKKALSGMQVMPGMELYTIANLSSVWINAQVYEYEIPKVRVGQHASIQLTYAPGETFDGRVAYVYPYLDPKSRTVSVRLVFDNRHMFLKPEMYADVTIDVDPGRTQLTVPADAVLDSGERKLVFLAEKGGYFSPREIVTGERNGNYYVVLQGVSANQRVVTGANFLLDSESQLKAAVSNMEGGHHH